jgi:hypothetical protein
MLNVTNITPPRVPLVDEHTGLISREWYRFLLNLFVLTGSGASSATLEDLQVVPPAIDYSADLAGLQNQIATAPPVFDYAGELANLQNEFETIPPPIDYTAAINSVRADLEIGTQPPTIPPQSTGYAAQPSAISVSASPFTYINQTGATADVMISGGGVSLLEFSRDGTTFFSTGSFYGMFTLSPYDRLRATYAVAPTMTLVPR